jgi:hypothetical protein
MVSANGRTCTKFFFCKNDIYLHTIFSGEDIVLVLPDICDILGLMDGDILVQQGAPCFLDAYL